MHLICNSVNALSSVRYTGIYLGVAIYRRFSAPTKKNRRESGLATRVARAGYHNMETYGAKDNPERVNEHLLSSQFDPVVRLNISVLLPVATDWLINV